MPADDTPATISIKCPQVRVRTTIRFVYRILQHDGDQELERGEAPLNLFPPDLTRGWAELFRDKKLVVVDTAEGLPKLLEAAKVPYTRLDDASRITDADVVLVGVDQLDDSTFAQAALLTVAEQGRSVMIFHQSKPMQLANYPLRSRPAPQKLEWKLDHPLFGQFSEADVQSWLVTGASLRAIDLPADEPALELAYWPPETPGKKPAPVEAIALTKSTGTGRIVLCEIPLGGWQSDPRSQMLLGNALAYLLSPPQPTLKPSERVVLTTQKVEETKLSRDHQ